MSGLLGTGAPLSSDVALVLEIIILIILFTSRFRFARGKKFVRHGYSMTAAVVLHLITILLVMVPSFLNFAPSLNTLNEAGVIILLIHVPLGTIAWLIGLFLVVEWRFRSEATLPCAKRKRLMKPLFALWVIALILGITVYSFYVFPELFLA